ncbi:unnamed protein product, partial [Linum tenue]
RGGAAKEEVRANDGSANGAGDGLTAGESHFHLPFWILNNRQDNGGAVTVLDFRK